jgi:hypothetical protein
MPLDSGDIAEERIALYADDKIAALRPVRIVLETAGNVGAALRAARERLGLAEDDIAQFTRVRSAYIAAIEAFDFDALPSRPFVVGYVRAYALALGLEPEAVVARFHAEAPKVDGKLRPPGGVSYDAFASIRRLLIVGAMVVAAVTVWNLARRAELRAAEHTSAACRRPRRRRPRRSTRPPASRPPTLPRRRRLPCRRPLRPTALPTACRAPRRSRRAEQSTGRRPPPGTSCCRPVSPPR